MTDISLKLPVGLPLLTSLPAKCFSSKQTASQRWLTVCSASSHASRIPKLVVVRDFKSPMSPTITGFRNSPDEGKGMARDFRVRWALEEVRLPYAMDFVSMAELKEPAYLARHPFGKIPVYEEDGMVLFETGAIVLSIAARHTGLLPADEKRRVQAIVWMFAALSTVEPPILERETILYVEQDKPWSKQRMPLVEDRVRDRLGQLAARLGDADWLDGDFTCGDLMTIDVLRRLEGSGLIEEFPRLAAWIARGEARPAFGRAREAQRSDWEKTSAEAASGFIPGQAGSRAATQAGTTPP